MRVRRIPGKVRLAILFGSVFSKILMILFCVGLFVITLVIKNTDFSVDDWSDVQRGIGTITKVEKTNYSNNDKFFYKYTFTYVVADSKLEDCSFGTGILHQGTNVNIEYLIKDSSKARIVGLSGKPMSPFLAVLFSFFLIPFLIIYVNYLKTISVLENGIMVKGEFVKKEDYPAFAQSPSDSLWYLAKFYFKFMDQDGKQHTIIEWAESPNYFERTKDASMLYDPLRPGSAKVLHMINGAPLTILDEEIKGEISILSVIAGLVFLIVCIVSLYNLLF